MPELMDRADRIDVLTSATIYLIETEGITALTLRRIAAVARVSPSSVLSHLETKGRLVDLMTKRISSRLVAELRSSIRRNGALGLVPEEQTLPLVRAWLAMCELARGDEALAPSVAYLVEEDHREQVQRACRLAHDDEVALDLMSALTTGLWLAMCDRCEPMSRERAVAALRQVCRALGVPMDSAAA